MSVQRSSHNAVTWILSALFAAYLCRLAQEEEQDTANNSVGDGDENPRPKGPFPGFLAELMQGRRQCGTQPHA
jgi:hypothetical protein